MVKYSDYGEVYCTTLPEIARDKLICVSRIGQGEFGEVDLCQLENRKVAVKKLHGISQADEFSFHREIRVLGKKLSFRACYVHDNSFRKSQTSERS